MKDVLYTKYNSLRKPEYQIGTSIYLEDGQKYVEKKAIQQSAIAHIETISQNADKIRDLYADIKILSGEREEKRIVFPFLDGKSLLWDLDVHNDTLDQIVEKLQRVIDKINQYHPAYIKEFEMTEDFREFFGEVSPKAEPAISIANLDGIFGNFVETRDGNVWCIDCEWVVEFPVPIRFITYRCLQYFYIENYVFLRNKAEEPDFIKAFGFSEEDLNLFAAMEEAFQQQIFGKNHEYIYVNNYKKPSETFESVMHGLHGLEDKNRDLERIVGEQQAYIERMQKAMKNPLYAAKLMIGKITEKIKK